VGFDFDYASFTRQEMLKTGPDPILWMSYQAPNYRIAMHVAELLDTLVFRVNIEVVITRQPEGFLSRLFGDGCFQCLNGFAESFVFRFGNQKMNVLWHDDVAEDKKDIPSARLLQRALEEVAGFRVAEIWQPCMTTEGEEMEVPG